MSVTPATEGQELQAPETTPTPAPSPKPTARRPATRPQPPPSKAIDSLTRTLDGQWNNYLDYLARFEQKASEKNVHDLRVSIRRLMTCIDLIDRLNPDTLVRRARNTLKEQLSELSALRDVHVEMLGVRRFLKELPEIQDFYDELRQRKSRCLKAARKIPSKSDQKSLENAIARAKIRLNARRATMTEQIVTRTIESALGNLFEGLVKELEAVSLTDYGTIHRVRLAFKPFRYMLEIAQPLLPTEHGQLRRAASLARIMGRVQDLEVLMKELAEFDFVEEPAREGVIELWLELERQKVEAAHRFLRAIPNFGKIWKPMPEQPSAKKTIPSKTFYVLRHAIAVQRGDVGYPVDADRPLTSKGIKKMRKIANGMRRLRVKFDVILTSPYRRALETAFIVGRQFRDGESIQTSPALKPDVFPEEVVKVLQDQYATCKRLLLVGHEPQLSSFISTLTSGSGGALPVLKKGGLCKLQVNGLQTGRCATMGWLLTPKQLVNIR